MNMAEAAAYIGSTEASLRNNYARWGIPVVRIGRRVKFRERTLNLWINEHADRDAS
jgi:hypothetical protein